MPELKFVLIGFVAGVNAVVPIMMLLLLLMSVPTAARAAAPLSEAERVSLSRYVFGVMGRALFGENDPMHFGSVPISVLSLFRCATLSGWLEMYQINSFGCEVHRDYPRVNESVTIHTKFGAFYDAVCYAPEPQPVVASLFFGNGRW